MKNKIKVFFIIPTLFAGGAERVMSFVSQNLDKEKFDVTLIVIGYEKDGKYDISGITVKYLNKKRVLNSFFSLKKLLREEKPNIVVSAITHLNIFMGFISVLFPKIKFIGRHTIVTIEDENFKKENKKSFLKNIEYTIRKPFSFGYKLLDIIICQSKDMYNEMKDKSNMPEHKLKIINNPITDNFKLKSQNTEGADVIKYITVARISKNKGHKRIIMALAKLNFPYQYTIIGDGAEKNNLFNLIDELDLQDKIIYIPFTTEVSKYLSNSDVYLMGSYSEGLPNSLIESCSVGTPAIAFKAPGGLNEIIEEGVNGFLVNSEAEFLEKLNGSQEWDPIEIRKSVYKKYNKDKIIDDYESMFLEILN
jgi:glycosyltransferase involved in cell wall biosynthesis